MVAPINFQICGRRTALTSIHWLQNLGYNSTTNPEYKGSGREGFDAASDWCMGCSGRERYSKCHWPSAQVYLHTCI